MKKTVKKIFKVLGIVLGVILLVLIAYIIYLYASYHRIEDNLVLEVESAPDAGEDLEGLTSGARPDSASARYNTALTTGETYSALTYNLGFGAYTPDFSFFMDGGRSSWAANRCTATPFCRSRSTRECPTAAHQATSSAALQSSEMSSRRYTSPSRG